MMSSSGMFNFPMANIEITDATVCQTDDEEHGNIRTCDLSWKKHIIDNAFDYAFSVHLHDVDNDGDCDVLGAYSEWSDALVVSIPKIKYHTGI